MLTSILSFLVILFITAKLYSGIKNETPGNLIELKDINESIRKLSNVWWFLIPIFSFLAIFYNLGVTGVWLLLIVLGWFVKLFKWIWTEIVIAAGWRLIRICFHYFILWPWRIFKAAFEALRPAANRSNYIVAIIGLFLSFLLVFLGKFLNEECHLPYYLRHICTLISILPLGISISTIIYSINTPVAGRPLRTYLKHCSLLILLFLGLFLIEGVLIYLGSYTPYKYLLSSIAVAGSLIGSGLIIFNAALLIFILSALPSFSLHYNGNDRFFKAFGSHLFHKWTQYLLVIPAFVIPAVLICIIPYFITRGISFVSERTTDKVYQYRIEKLNEKISSQGKIADYKNWMDVEKVSDSLFTQLKQNDYANREDRLELAALENNRGYLSQFYSKYSSPIGAAPVGILGKAYQFYGREHERMVNTQAYQIAQTDSTTYVENREAIKENSAKQEQDILSLESQIKTSEEKIAALNEQLASVCVPASPPAETPKAEKESPVIPENVPVDNCDVIRENLRAQINSESQAKADFEKAESTKKLGIARNKAIMEHVYQLKEREITLKSNELISAKCGYLFITIWLSFLLAVAFGLGLSLFAHLNHAVFNMNDVERKWMVISEIEKANSVNPNQPLLGLTLLPLLLFVLLLISIRFSPTHLLNKGWNAVKDSIEMPARIYNEH